MMNMRNLRMMAILVGVMSVPVAGMDRNESVEVRAVEEDCGSDADNDSDEYTKLPKKNLSGFGALTNYGLKIALNSATASLSYLAIALPTTSTLISHRVIESASHNLILKRAIPGFAAAAILFGVICEGVYGFRELKKTNQTTYPGAAARGFLVGNFMYLTFLEMFLNPKIPFLK
jgi:hypothetical protein